MTEQSAAVIPSHPPEAIMRVMNPLLRKLLPTPFAGGARREFMVLSFTGRKSGRQFTIPVSAHLLDGRLYALAGAPWKVNFRGGAPAQVLCTHEQVTPHPPPPGPYPTTTDGPTP